MPFCKVALPSLREFSENKRMDDTRTQQKVQTIAESLNAGLKLSRELVDAYNKAIQRNASQSNSATPSESSGPGSHKSD